MKDENANGEAGPGRAFDRVIALDWYDGPRSGLASRSGSEYRFDLLDETTDDPSGRDVRIFSLSPLPPGSIDRFAAAVSRFDEPRLPVWVPSWLFPAEADRAAMDAMADEILRSAGPPVQAVASTDFDRESLAAIDLSGIDPASVEDWFVLLGIERVHVGS